MRRRPVATLWTGLVLSALASCATCAPVQRVPIDSAPRDSSVFVDGDPVGTAPVEVELRADRDHSVFIKRDGYRPELIILRSQVRDSRPRLEPGDVRVRLVPIERGRELDIEVDRRRDGVPDDPEWQRSR